MMSRYIYNAGLLFAQVSGNNKERIAVRYQGNNNISFGYLEETSNRISHFLSSKGLKKGDVLAIFNNKSPLALAAMLAALKSGIIYTNLDPYSPAQRISKITENCKPSLALVDEFPTPITAIQAITSEICYLDDEFRESLAVYSPDLPPICPSVTGSDPAYIMFTSGSTGFPKGAVITHANLLNFISWGQNEFDIACDDILTNVNPIYFDNSVFDFYVSLFSGASLAPLGTEVTRDPFKLVAEVAALKCTTWFSVPSLLIYLITTKALSTESFPSIRQFIFGGEGFPKPNLKKLYSMYGSKARLFNVYGPTECTCICSAYQISETDFANMSALAPLGHLSPNFDFVLLDASEEGTFGELGIRGPNVGAGYYNDPQRTQASFVQNPFVSAYRDIIYRSGDLVQIDENGFLHFRGRSDNQVKHMGYRIELEEIENNLNAIPYIVEAAVIYERITESLGQIVAFVATKSAVDNNEIITDLKLLVPEYMIPRKLHIFEQLPKNQNGKIDRSALKTINK